MVVYGLDVSFVWNRGALRFEEAGRDGNKVRDQGILRTSFDQENDFLVMIIRFLCYVRTSLIDKYRSRCYQVHMTCVK